MIKPQRTGAYEIETSIEINSSKEQAWKVLRDFSNVEWAPGITKSHALGEREACVGAGRHCVIEGFGGIDEYVLQWAEGEGFVYDITPLGPLHNLISSWWLVDIDETHCRLNIVMSYDLRFSFFGKIIHGLIMRRKLEASLPKTALAVKNRVEHINANEFELKQSPAT